MASSVANCVSAMWSPEYRFCGSLDFILTICGHTSLYVSNPFLLGHLKISTDRKTRGNLK